MRRGALRDRDSPCDTQSNTCLLSAPMGEKSLRLSIYFQPTNQRRRSDNSISPIAICSSKGFVNGPEREVAPTVMYYRTRHFTAGTHVAASHHVGHVVYSVPDWGPNIRRGPNHISRSDANKPPHYTGRCAIPLSSVHLPQKPCPISPTSHAYPTPASPE